MLKIGKIIVTVLFILDVSKTIGSQIPAKEELLSLYEKSIGLPDKISFTTDNTSRNIEGIESPKDRIWHFVLYRNGANRAAIGSSTLILDKRCYLINGDPLTISIFSEKERKVAESYFFGSMGGLMINEGIILGTMEGMEIVGDKRLPDYLRECSILKVRDQQEYIDNHPTYVLEGQGNQGKFILWLDPNAGFRPRKVESYKAGDDLLYGKPLSSYLRFGANKEAKNKKLKEYGITIDSIKIEEINGAIFITSCKMTETRIYTDGYKFIFSDNTNISNINLNPDFDELKPFDINVPDGTPVLDGDFPAGRFEVRQGKIVFVSTGKSFEEIDKTIDQFKQQQ